MLRYCAKASLPARLGTRHGSARRVSGVSRGSENCAELRRDELAWDVCVVLVYGKKISIILVQKGDKRFAPLWFGPLGVWDLHAQHQTGKEILPRPP